MQSEEIFYLPAEMQPSATDARGKHRNVNEPLGTAEEILQLLKNSDKV